MKRFVLTAVLALLVSVSGQGQAQSIDELSLSGGCGHCGTQGLAMDGAMYGGDGGCGACACSASASPWFAGQEYLLLRTHFSEGLAFARVSDSMVGGVFNRRVSAAELDFDYDSSFRSMLGYHWNECTDIRFTYWHLDVDTHVSGVAGPGEAIVDPFGGFAPTGAEIATMAAVKMNVYDLAVVRPLYFRGPNLGLEYSAGLRFADVEQFYDSTIRNGGQLTSNGIWSADFFGVGPYFAVTGNITPPRHDRLSLTAKWGSSLLAGGTALMVGGYDVSSQFTVPGAVVGGQSASRTRVVPVTEMELGGQWRATNRLSLSAGWLFQAWWNLGASGGTFDTENTPLGGDAAFVGTDDADIMSFDGLYVRGELNF